MGIQDADTSSTTITDYGVGGRGIDWMQISNANGSQVKYPVYDGHGNMVATLTKNGTGCSIGDPRSYDAWGNCERRGLGRSEEAILRQPRA